MSALSKMIPPCRLSVDIDDLARHPHLLPVLAWWHQREWQRYAHPTTLQQRIEKLQSHLHQGTLPRTWLAFVGNQVVGSVSLVTYKMSDTETDGVWLANLFVLPAQRCRGIGSTLVHWAVDEAALRGYAQLQLFTTDKQDYYRRLQWRWCRRTRLQGHWVDVMRYHVPTYRPAWRDGCQGSMLGYFTRN